MTHCNECGDLIPIRSYCHTCYVQLQADNARLREIVDAKVVELGLDTLLAQRMRLREALEKQINLYDYLAQPSALTAEDMADIARAALKED